MHATTVFHGIGRKSRRGCVKIPIAYDVDYASKPDWMILAPLPGKSEYFDTGIIVQISNERNHHEDCQKYGSDCEL
jgi:hypothetical protein